MTTQKVIDDKNTQLTMETTEAPASAVENIVRKFLGDGIAEFLGYKAQSGHMKKIVFSDKVESFVRTSGGSMAYSQGDTRLDVDFNEAAAIEAKGVAESAKIAAKTELTRAKGETASALTRLIREKRRSRPSRNTK